MYPRNKALTMGRFGVAKDGFEDVIYMPYLKQRF